MSDTPKYDADKLVAVYIKIRDRKEAIAREYEEKLEDLNHQLRVISTELLQICKNTGQDGGRTAHGTFTRTVKTRYWTSNWEAMREFIKEHDALDLLEQRIHQGNMKTFLKENPNVFPEGMNVDSEYAITVRRSSK